MAGAAPKNKQKGKAKIAYTRRFIRNTPTIIGALSVATYITFPCTRKSFTNVVVTIGIT